MVYEILEISMKTSTVINVSQILDENSKQYLSQCIQTLTANREYEIALRIAKIAGLSIDDILISEWKYKHEQLVMKEDSVDCKALTSFIAQASEAFKKASMSLDGALSFFNFFVTKISDPLQKFYSFRIMLGWYEENLVFDKNREQLEHLMWASYFECDLRSEPFLNSCHNTLHFVINGQKDTTFSKINLSHLEKPFSKLMCEIEVDSNVVNIENVVVLTEQETINTWRKTINSLLELKLIVEAYRLSRLFKVPTEIMYRSPPCPFQILSTSLKLAEGECSPYELPQELRLVIASPSLQQKLSSKKSVASYYCI